MIVSLANNINIIIAANIFLLSLILITQFVSYPLFLKVRDEDFTEYHKRYTFSISIIVVPTMVIELLSSLNFLFYELNTISIVNAILVALIWTSTFAIQVPIHNKLSIMYNETNIRRLIKTNWIRTIAWTIKLFVILNPYTG